MKVIRVVSPEDWGDCSEFKCEYAAEFCIAIGRGRYPYLCRRHLFQLREMIDKLEDEASERKYTPIAWGYCGKCGTLHELDNPTVRCPEPSRDR